MEELSDFFLELSHNDRLRILFLIEEKRLRLTQISEGLNLSIQETSRHLSRLRDAKLLARDPDGFYYLTPFGQTTLHLLPGCNFILENRDYPQNHDLSYLPPEFIERIGELEEYEKGKGVMQVLHKAVVVIQEAKEYVWILTDQVMTLTIPMIIVACAKGVRFRILLPEKLTLPPSFQLPKPPPMIPVEIKRLREVGVCIIMNEALAGICLPNSTEKIDHGTGFASRDPKFHKWCRDLFLHYWESGGAR